jgi:Uma2 family endonuclease
MATILENPVLPKSMTAEEFFQIRGIDRAELVNGKMVEVSPVGFEHGDYVAELIFFLQSFVRRAKIGSIVTETGFKLRSNPDVVRAPDVAFIETASVPSPAQRKKFVDGSPTLAIEIVSSSEAWGDVEEKVNQYLEAGTVEVWIVEPEHQTLTIRTPDEAPQVLRRGDVLRCEKVLPGFELNLLEFFDRD